MKNLLLTMIFLLLVVFTFGINTQADIIKVEKNGSGDYITIQDGVNASNSGDTIYVAQGTYYENILLDNTISSNLTLMGGFDALDWSLDIESNKTIINGYFSCSLANFPRVLSIIFLIQNYISNVLFFHPFFI